MEIVIRASKYGNPGIASGHVMRNPAGRRAADRERVPTLDAVRVNSLGFRTDLMLRLLEGGKVTDYGDYLTLHSPRNPAFWWGNFLLMPEWALRDEADRWISRFAQAFPGAGHVALGVDGTGGCTRSAGELSQGRLPARVQHGHDGHRRTGATAP